MTNYPKSRKSNIVVQDVENDVLIYDLTISKAFCLNETSGLVFRLCDGTRTAAQISDEMSKQLKTLVSEDLVYLALNELKKNNLLENGEEVPNHFAGLTRREAIRRVGLASMAALPIVASIIAPTAVHAQSCIPSQQNLACTTNGECCNMGLCVGAPMVCACTCVGPGDCLAQTSCPSTVNCNGAGQCAP